MNATKDATGLMVYHQSQTPYGVDQAEYKDAQGKYKSLSTLPPLALMQIHTPALV
jgi:hypothetical protein